jgi:hypothetical protein
LLPMVMLFDNVVCDLFVICFDNGDVIWSVGVFLLDNRGY